MKYLFSILFLGLCAKAFCQDLSIYEHNTVRIIDSGVTVQADIEPYNSAPKIKNNVFYYWYNANQIHATQGGFSGQLLNGHYSSFYPNKNLKEQGDFERGLKQGTWKNWNEKGELVGVINWNEGVKVSEQPKTLWQKLDFFKKKKQ